MKHLLSYLILKSLKKLWTDQGSEFINNKFKDFLKSNNIDLYHVYNEGKACVIERFNRTLGEMISKHLTANKTSKYIDVLPKFINDYNNKYHTSIKMSPVECTKTEPKFQSTIINKAKPKFKVGDRVRISAHKSIFDKGSKANWTKEIFIIDKIKRTDPITYTIKDQNNEIILGSMYEPELQLTKF